MPVQCKIGSTRQDKPALVVNALEKHHRAQQRLRGIVALRASAFTIARNPLRHVLRVLDEESSALHAKSQHVLGSAATLTHLLSIAGWRESIEG